MKNKMNEIRKALVANRNGLETNILKKHVQ